MYTYTWEHGRQLACVSADGSADWNFTYNADGLRTGRTNGTRTYEYIYSGSQLVQMKYNNYTLYFTYDASGMPLTVTYNGTTYYYATNIQGDVVAILDSTGTAVVNYIYDSWGKALSRTGSMASTLGKHNPLRYRGYVYDNETGLYYLQSRYYDPEFGRFINADGLAATGYGFIGNNMFAYCLNNPVNYIDPYGYAPGDLFNTMDEAAKDAALYIGELSFKTGWEYGVSIDKVVYWATKEVPKFTTGVYWIDIFLAALFGTGSTYTIYYIETKYTYYAYYTDKSPKEVIPQNTLDTVAVVHTHPLGSGSGITQVSGWDKEYARTYRMPVYVYGPNGELHKYLPNGDTVVLSGLPKSKYPHWLD